MGKVFWTDEGISVEKKYDHKNRKKERVILKDLGKN